MAKTPSPDNLHFFIGSPEEIKAESEAYLAARLAKNPHDISAISGLLSTAIASAMYQTLQKIAETTPDIDPEQMGFAFDAGVASALASMTTTVAPVGTRIPTFIGMMQRVTNRGLDILIDTEANDMPGTKDTPQ